MTKLTAFVEKYGLLSLEKQDKLAYLLGEHRCELDLDTGKAHFNNFQFPFQVLGTESDNTLTWLWAWAEEQSEVPADLITASRTLRTWGSSAGIREFSIPSVDLTRADGLLFSLIASEVCKASCYYCDAYEGGALYVLIFDNIIDIQPSFDLNLLIKQLLYLISRYDLDHRKALLSYLTVKGLSPLASESQITCRLQTGELLNAGFDAAGRLLLLQGEVIKP